MLSFLNAQVESQTKLLTHQKKQYLQTRMTDAQERALALENDENRPVLAQLSQRSYVTHAINTSSQNRLSAAVEAPVDLNREKTPLRPKTSTPLRIVSPKKAATPAPKKSNKIDDISSFKEYAEMERKLGSYILDLGKEKKAIESQHAYLKTHTHMDEVSQSGFVNAHIKDECSSSDESADENSFIKY
jgi:hypothetical protein